MHALFSARSTHGCGSVPLETVFVRVVVSRGEVRKKVFLVHEFARHVLVRGEREARARGALLFIA